MEKYEKCQSEKVLLAYISEKSKKVKPSTLWSYYFMLKCTLLVNENCNISKLSQEKQPIFKNPKITIPEVGSAKEDKIYKEENNLKQCVARLEAISTPKIICEFKTGDTETISGEEIVISDDSDSDSDLCVVDNITRVANNKSIGKSLETNRNKKSVKVVKSTDASKNIKITKSSTEQTTESSIDEIMVTINDDSVVEQPCTSNETYDTDIPIEVEVEEDQYDTNQLPSALEKVLQVFGRSIAQHYKCPECNKSFNDSFQLKRHSLIHKKRVDRVQNKPSFSCYICLKKFALRNSLWMHMRDHSRTKKLAPGYKCKKCNAEFKVSREFSAHKSSCSGESNNCATQKEIPSINLSPDTLKYRCNICKQKFADLFQMRTHKKLHSIDTPTLLDGHSTPVTTTLKTETTSSPLFEKNQSNSMQNNASLASTDEQTVQAENDLFKNIVDSSTVAELKPQYKCCEILFAERNELYLHLKQQASSASGTINCEPLYCCKVCIEEFKERREWYFHCKNVHTNHSYSETNKSAIKRRKPRYACGACHMKFDSISKLTQHKLSEHSTIDSLEKDSRCDPQVKTNHLKAEFERLFCQKSDSKRDGGVSDNVELESLIDEDNVQTKSQEEDEIYRPVTSGNNESKITVPTIDLEVELLNPNYECRCDICDDVFEDNEAFLEHQAFHEEIEMPMKEQTTLDVPSIISKQEKPPQETPIIYNILMPGLVPFNKLNSGAIKRIEENDALNQPSFVTDHPQTTNKSRLNIEFPNDNIIEYLKQPDVTIRRLNTLNETSCIPENPFVISDVRSLAEPSLLKSYLTDPVGTSDVNNKKIEVDERSKPVKLPTFKLVSKFQLNKTKTSGHTVLPNEARHSVNNIAPVSSTINKSKKVLLKIKKIKRTENTFQHILAKPSTTTKTPCLKGAIDVTQPVLQNNIFEMGPAVDHQIVTAIGADSTELNQQVVSNFANLESLLTGLGINPVPTLSVANSDVNMVVLRGELEDEANRVASSNILKTHLLQENSNKQSSEQLRSKQLKYSVQPCGDVVTLSDDSLDEAIVEPSPLLQPSITETSGYGPPAVEQTDGSTPTSYLNTFLDFLGQPRTEL